MIDGSTATYESVEQALDAALATIKPSVMKHVRKMQQIRPAAPKQPAPELPLKVKRIIAALMKAKKLTSDQIAERIGVTPEDVRYTICEHRNKLPNHGLRLIGLRGRTGGYKLERI